MEILYHVVIFNSPMQFPIYYCMFANKNQNGGSLGWPQIYKYIKKEDTSNLIGQTVAMHVFKPFAGFLTRPWTVYSGYCETNRRNVNDFTYIQRTRLKNRKPYIKCRNVNIKK